MDIKSLHSNHSLKILAPEYQTAKEIEAIRQAPELAGETIDHIEKIETARYRVILASGETRFVSIAYHPSHLCGPAIFTLNFEKQNAPASSAKASRRHQVNLARRV